MTDSGAQQRFHEDDDARAARYSDLFATSHDHTSDCSLCPICATISVLRQTKPEVVEHLATAARELLAAAAILIAEAESVVGAAEEPTAPGPDSSTVRRIDVV
ncbi:MAG: hypothetical protein M3516_09195 [Actinomycetota bacterium]|nr:hypothetical protein [Actinomycetota bacterium]